MFNTRSQQFYHVYIGFCFIHAHDELYCDDSFARTNLGSLACELGLNVRRVLVTSVLQVASYFQIMVARKTNVESTGRGNSDFERGHRFL